MASPKTSSSVSAGKGTKEAIRAEAVRLFGVKGFEQTSLREIADAVGITKASLYYHYASKLDLLVASIDPIIDHLRGTVEDIGAMPYDKEGIRSVLRNYLRGLIRHRAAGSLILRDTVAIFNAMADRYPDLLDLNSELRDWLAGPDKSAESRLRASAALEILGVALVSSELAPGANDDLIERILLDSALSVLIADDADRDHLP